LKSLNSNENKIDKTFFELKLKENEYLELGVNNEIKKNEIVKEYSGIQEKIILEIFQNLVKALIPVELKSFEKIILQVHDISKFNNLDHLIDIIAHNQIILENTYNFKYVKENASLPFKLFYFYELLKHLIHRFREFFFEVKKL